MPVLPVSLWPRSKLSAGLKTSLLVTAYDMETSGPFMFCYVHDKLPEQRFHGYLNLSGREGPKPAVGCMIRCRQ